MKWRLSVPEIAAIAVFWSIVGLLTIIQYSFDPRYDQPSNIWSAHSAHQALVYACWGLLTPAIFWFSHRFGPERVDWRKFTPVYFLVGVVVAIVFHLFIHVLWNVIVADASSRPLSFGYVVSGLHFLPEFLIYLLVLAAGFARDYAVRYRQRVLEAARLRAEAGELESRLRAKDAELKAQLVEARLHTLQTQINPDFLFNTLNAITSLADVDPKRVSRVVNLLSEILRYSLMYSNETEVSLRQELAFVDRYLEIQKIRFGDKLNVYRDVSPEALEASIPSLILQPLVEHAVKQGVDPLDGSGRVEIKAWREDGDLYLSVRDHGPAVAAGMRDEANSTLSNIKSPAALVRTRERLRSLYGGDRELSLEHASGGGLRAALRLPYKSRPYAADSHQSDSHKFGPDMP